MTTETRPRAASPGTGPLPWAALLALSFATFSTVTAEMIPAGLLPGMTAGFGVSEARIGLLVSVWAVTVAMTSLPLVRLTARIDQRALMIGALATLTATNAVTALAPSYGVALGSRVAGAAVHGLFWSIVMAHASTIVRSDQIGRAAAVVLAGPTVAGVVGIPVGAVLGDVASWRLAFWMVAGLMSLSALALWLLLPGGAGARGADAGALSWDATARPVVVLAAVGALVLVGHYLLYTYIAPVLTDLGGFAVSSVGPVLLLFGVGGMAGLTVAGTLADRWPVGSLLACTALFASSTTSVSLLAQSRPLGLLAIAVWGLMIGVLPVLVQTAMLRTASTSFRPTAGAILVTAMNGGVAVGAAVGGPALEHGGPRVLALAAGGMGSTAVLLLVIRSLLARRPGRDESGRAEPDRAVGGQVATRRLGVARDQDLESVGQGDRLTAEVDQHGHVGPAAAARPVREGDDVLLVTGLPGEGTEAEAQGTT